MRNYRKKAGISQEELADKAGLHRTHVSLIEREKRNVSIVTIEKIAKALDIEPYRLLRP
ncbi:MAG: helix-turn-helix transcriptional regulator [Anaerolineales bacterium]|nr:helix-turn-helix transcriptional regulator [Anaerolineales bacterium]